MESSEISFLYIRVINVIYLCDEFLDKRRQRCYIAIRIDLTISIFCLSECVVKWELYNGSCYSLVSATSSISRSIEEASDVCQQSHPSSRLPSLHSLGEAR